jgi:Coenzyme PQQ synthesis protein D (PqqD)
VQTHPILPANFIEDFDVAGGIILWDTLNCRLLVYNQTAALLWRRLKSGAALSSLWRILIDHYSISPVRAASDCAELISHFISEGLVTGHSASDHSARPLIEPDQAGAQSFLDRDVAVISLEGKTLAIHAHRNILRVLKPLLECAEASPPWTDGRIVVMSNELAEAIVFLNGQERARVKSEAEIIGAIYQLTIEFLHPNTDWLGFMHAGAIAKCGSVVVLAGPSGSGKSTLVASMMGLGYTYFSDDVVPITISGLAVPCPLAVSLKPGSRGLFPIPDGFRTRRVYNQKTDQYLLPPKGAWNQAHGKITAVVFPMFTPGSQTVFNRLSTLEAIQRLLTDRIYMGFPLTRAAIERFIAWIESVPCFELISSDLKEAQGCLEKLWA